MFDSLDHIEGLKDKYHVLPLIDLWALSLVVDAKTYGDFRNRIVGIREKIKDQFSNYYGYSNLFYPFTLLRSAGRSASWGLNSGIYSLKAIASDLAANSILKDSFTLQKVDELYQYSINTSERGGGLVGLSDFLGRRVIRVIVYGLVALLLSWLCGLLLPLSHDQFPNLDFKTSQVAEGIATAVTFGAALLSLRYLLMLIARLREIWQDRADYFEDYGNYIEKGDVAPNDPDGYPPVG